MDSSDAVLRRKIVSHLNAWAETGGIEFTETQDVGQVRISRGPGGYWSYLGTDILLIPRNRPTMNLQSFTLNTSDSEYRRVVRHEAGHTLGMPHEHMRKELVARIDPQKAYAYIFREYRWDKTTVDQQVLTPLDNATLIGTRPDEDSIMCYRLPGEITYDGQPIRGGNDLNATDRAFVATIYPKPGRSRHTYEDVRPEHDWPESDDVGSIDF